ncbi:MAG TPA: M36 family metallopeptidase [Nocardioidaceae bacterium]|nr:M36 family metallopeptidase [Nocardioidaceae bacterium]
MAHTFSRSRRSLFCATALSGLLGIVVAVTGPGAATARSVTTTFPASARGTVFFPNPVQETGLQSLTDRKDSDYAALQPAYRRVTLTDLDRSGSLTGRWVRVKSATGAPARIEGGQLPAYHRDADQFEQVMGYYWVTTAHHYLSSLGFGSDLRAVNNRQIELRINQFGGDNSSFDENKANIRLGKGGVDDAEDAEVVVHEYGHSVQDSQVPGFGTNLEAGSIGEGFGDYFAVAVTDWATGVPTKTPEACVADWDSTSYTRDTPHCLRRLDGTKTYPADVVGEVHADGEIWSAALYDIRRRLADPRKADRIIVDAQFAFAADTSFRDAALATVAAARRLYPTQPATAAAVRQAFTARGLL